MNVDDDLLKTVVNTLQKFKLKPKYTSEQDDLQKHIHEEIYNVVENKYPHKYRVVRSTVGRSKPNVKALGTSFWPDLEIQTSQAKPEKEKYLIAIEVKWIKNNKSAAKHIEEAIGQAVIYSAKYKNSTAFILHEGKYASRQKDYDGQLISQLAKCNVKLIVRRRKCSLQSAISMTD
jgi:hypothetical protein